MRPWVGIVSVVEDHEVYLLENVPLYPVSAVGPVAAAHAVEHTVDVEKQNGLHGREHLLRFARADAGFCEPSA